MHTYCGLCVCMYESVHVCACMCECACGRGTGMHILTVPPLTCTHTKMQTNLRYKCPYTV